MLFEFSDVIRHAGLDLEGVRLARHSRDGLAQWRRHVRYFDDYVSIQRPGNLSPYNGASIAFQFVPGPTLADGDSSAMFVRAHRIGESWEWGSGERKHRLAVPDSRYHPSPELLAYDLEALPEFDQYSERILIRWGTSASARAWSQWAAKRPKEIVELRRLRSEQAFPGFAAFTAPIDEVDLFPETWRAVLASVGGVYLLVCPDSGEQYVGSAYGADGFLGRWSGYAADGHGGNKLLKSRRRSNYTIAILEVSSPDMAPSDVIRRESAWKAKLGSRAHGLNAN